MSRYQPKPFYQEDLQDETSTTSVSVYFKVSLSNSKILGLSLLGQFIRKNLDFSRGNSTISGNPMSTKQYCLVPMHGSEKLCIVVIFTL